MRVTADAQRSRASRLLATSGSVVSGSMNR